MLIILSKFYLLSQNFELNLHAKLRLFSDITKEMELFNTI